jgi:O-antigen/teichoic acid export membrane protein
LTTSEATADVDARIAGPALLGGSAWSAASLIIPQFYVVATSILAARFLTPSEMGRQSYIAFISLSLTYLATAGVPTAFQRVGAEALGRGEHGQLAYLLTWSRRIEVVAAALAGGVMGAAAALGSEPRAAWLFAGGVCVIGVLQSVPASALAVLQRWRGISVTGIVIGAVSTIAVAIVLAAGGGITGMFAVEFAVWSVGLGVSWWLAREAMAELRARPVRSMELRRRAISWALASTFTGILAFVVWRRSEFFFLNAFSTDREIAMYSIAFAAMTALMKPPEAVGMVLSPAFATMSGARQAERISARYARGIRMILLLSLPLTAFAMAIGPAAIELAYGSAYSDAGTLFLIMAPTLPLLSLMGVSRGLIAGVGRQRSLISVGIFAAVTNVLLAVVLISHYDATGAAVSNAAAQVLAVGAYIALARKLAGSARITFAAVARNAVAAAAAGGAAWAACSALGGVAGAVAGIVVFFAAYLGLAMLLGVIPRGDADWLESLAGDHMAGRRENLTRRLIAGLTRA